MSGGGWVDINRTVDGPCIISTPLPGVSHNDSILIDAMACPGVTRDSIVMRLVH